MAHTPAEIAAADQRWAKIAMDLEAIVKLYQRHAENGYDQNAILGHLTTILRCPHDIDGNDVGRELHANMLAEFAAMAVCQLAKAGAR